MNARAFLSSIGVNTHMDATSTGYGNVTTVRSALAYIGVTAIRDHAYDIDIPAFQQMAADGVRLDLIVDTDTEHELETMLPVASQIDTFEGSNEVDYQPVTVPGIHGAVASAIAAQKALYTDAHAIPEFAGIPVVNQSLAFPTSYTKYLGALAYADIANVHLYAGDGNTPQTYIVPTLAADTAKTVKPTIETETGYYTLANNPTDPSGVSAAVQASMIADELFDNYAAGITKTYLYELLDEGPDPQADDREMHYGLFNADFSPKPAATALHNLSTILGDAGVSGVGAVSIAPTVTGLPATGRSITLSGANGTDFVVVWAEPAVWDQFTQHDLPPSPAAVSVDLGTLAPAVSVYDPLNGTTPIATYTNQRTVPLTVTDHPLIVRAAPSVDPATTAPVAVPISASTVSWTDTSSIAAGTDALSSRYDWTRADSVNLAANGASVTLIGGAGTDALTAKAGNNTLDGGTGSSFLVGSTGADGGTDQFFVDGRGATPTWSTIVHFHRGDVATLWGFEFGTSTIAWGADEGATGYAGATLHSALAGVGTTVNASLTLTGLSLADVTTKITVTHGTTGGVSYLRLGFSG